MSKTSTAVRRVLSRESRGHVPREVAIRGSEHIRSATYYPASQKLRVRFNNGTVYEFSEVTPTVFAGLRAAESHGCYFHRYIVDKPTKQIS
jgi:hypothetical protein